MKIDKNGKLAYKSNVEEWLSPVTWDEDSNEEVDEDENNE